MANAIKQAWREGRGTVNGWLAIPSGFSAEVMAQAGYDSVTVDMQHGVQDYASTIACFQGMQPHGVLPMARVPWLEAGIIGKVLDAGALGIICPMVNSPDEARTLVDCCRYPPAGKRSFGPIRAGLYGADTPYYDTADADVAVIPMIETRTALDQLDAILDVDGLDAIYVGPSDLGISLGLRPLLDREEPEMLRHYERLVRAARDRGLGAGIHCATGLYARRMLDMGFTFATPNNDSGLMALKARQEVAAARGG